MDTAKVFMNGRSQAVRLPKEYRFEDEEVYINKVGNVVMLYPKTDKWTILFEAISMFTDDCFNDAMEDLPPENVETL